MSPVGWRSRRTVWRQGANLSARTMLRHQQKKNPGAPVFSLLCIFAHVNAKHRQAAAVAGAAGLARRVPPAAARWWGLLAAARCLPVSLAREAWQAWTFGLWQSLRQLRARSCPARVPRAGSKLSASPFWPARSVRSPSKRPTCKIAAPNARMAACAVLFSAALALDCCCRVFQVHLRSPGRSSAVAAESAARTRNRWKNAHGSATEGCEGPSSPGPRAVGKTSTNKVGGSCPGPSTVCGANYQSRTENGRRAFAFTCRARDVAR